MRSGSWLPVVAACSTAAAWALGACTFPAYLPTLGASGGTSSGASAGAALGGGAATANGSGAGGTGGAGSPGTGGSDPGDAGEGSTEPPLPPEIGICGEREHYQHCLNHEHDEDETDIDCGGPACERCEAERFCARDRDCATGPCTAGQCPRLFELEYMQQNPDEETTSVRLEAKVTYLGSTQELLRDVTVRYYFSRNSVTEPLLSGGTAIQFPNGGDVSSAMTRKVVRQLRGNGITNDAYLEIGFTGGKVISQGDTLDLVADLTTGDTNSPFNQTTHHSYDTMTTLHESKKLSVYLRDKRMWGRGPEIDDPPSCLHEGVNIDGDVVEIAGEGWLRSPDSPLDRYLDNGVALKPPVSDKGLDEMLRSGFFLSDTSFTYPVDNGSYSLTVYVWSANGGETGTLRVNDEAYDRFHALSFDGGGPWVGLGPYRITIDDGMLQVGAQGILRVSGIELRTLDE